MKAPACATLGRWWGVSEHPMPALQGDSYKPAGEDKGQGQYGQTKAGEPELQEQGEQHACPGASGQRCTWLRAMAARLAL